MLKLQNVSKFYYQKGVITTGFSKVNLELNMGEFVVITGESGSGKSTLLNVLSGLDSYEEGEMYINGEETSHYDEKDFEEYRRKYVGNIFQNFNLVNSYSVYQNVELSLILNGESKAEVKAKVMDILEKVGLTKYARQKCSKLSGGQKQRVAIARALAKETPIIVADEPTGNLDSKSASEVMEILSKIAKDKLVIIVTHNLEQMEKYATRLIKMYDGKIVEDKQLGHEEIDESKQVRTYKDITIFNKIRLGIRNAFNIPVKFILIFVVFLFISLAVSGVYSSIQKSAYDDSVLGYNSYFNDTSDTRIVLVKQDGSEITEDDFAKLNEMLSIARVVKDDILVDYEQGFVSKSKDYFFYGNLYDIKDIGNKVDAGRLPENENEIILECSEDSYYIRYGLEAVFKEDFAYSEADGTGIELDYKYKIVGIVYTDSWRTRFYVNSSVIDALRPNIVKQFTNVNIKFQDQTFRGDRYGFFNNVIASEKVAEGTCIVPEEYNFYTSNGKAKGKSATIEAQNPYETNEVKLKVANVYTSKTFKKLTNIAWSDAYMNVIAISPADYSKLYTGKTFQSSVYVSDVHKLDAVNTELVNMGYKTLLLRDSMANETAEFLAILSLLETSVMVILIVALFFISYFIIRIVLKSRNAYYTTLRTLGASKRVTKQLLNIELFVMAVISFAVFMAVVILVGKGVINWPYILELEQYLRPISYAIIFVIIAVMSLLISNRFAKKLFQDSVMFSYREEA